MKIIRDFEKDMSVETLLAHIHSANPSLYEDDAEELLEIAAGKDAIHPAFAYRKAFVTGITENGVMIDGVPFESSLLKAKAAVGDAVYPCLSTAGAQLDAIGRELDDVMLQFLNGALMNACLDDALAAIAEEICRETAMQGLWMVKPGIAGRCGLSEQKTILSLLGNAPEECGVAVGDDGMLRPAYSGTCVFYPAADGTAFPMGNTSLEERMAFVAALDQAAGHI